MSGTPEPQLAREFDLTLNTGTFGSPVWTPISGITGITPNQSSQLTDDTDFDTDGWESGTVVQRGRTLDVSLLYKEDETAELDPGYEALIALGDSFGPGGKGDFRYLSPNGKGYRFNATVDVQWAGGDKTSNAATSASLKVDGAPVPINPPATAPDVTGAVPATGAAAGGTAITVVGTGFTGATLVAIGGDPATSVVVVNSTTITCVTPAHAAGAVAIAVTTPAGTDSAANAFTYA